MDAYVLGPGEGESVWALGGPFHGQAGAFDAGSSPGG